MSHTSGSSSGRSSPRPLEQRIKRYYAQQELSQDALSNLREMINQPQPQQVQSVDTPPEKESRIAALYDKIRNFLKPQSGMQLSLRPVALLVLFILSIGIAISILPIQTNHQSLELVAEEIALNHAKRFNAEFSTPNIASLVGIMPLLDFAPVHPKRMQWAAYHIMGARYCTIGNSIAVQIHLEDEQQQAYTLYEFRNPTSLVIEKETVIDVGDIQVTLWHEGDVAMGLAQRLQN